LNRHFIDLKIHIFGWTRSRKCLQINFRQLESSLYPLQLYRILGWQGEETKPLKSRSIDNTQFEFLASP